MPIKWIDPCISYGGEPTPDAMLPFLEAADIVQSVIYHKAKPKHTITVQIDTSEAQKKISELIKGMKFMEMYGGKPKPKAGVHNIPKPMKSNIVGMDFAALESKVSGGGVHPSFEIDKDITSQEFKVAMKIPSHYTTVAVPFSTMEHATHTGGLQPFLDELAKMLMHELTMKALAYLEASFTKSD